jgi:exo-beta-1,3-glucanase (GH17 family)
VTDLCRGSTIGICYGRNADDLPTPDKVAQLVQLHNIKYVRIYDSNVQVLKAFSNTGVELMIGIPNLDLLPFSQFQSNADSWLKNNILPYYPATKITCITVGAEVTENPNNVSALVCTRGSKFQLPIPLGFYPDHSHPLRGLLIVVMHFS